MMSRLLVDEWGLFGSYFKQENRAIAFLSVHSNNQVSALATEKPFDYGLLKNGNGGTQSLYRNRYTPEGEKIDNITDWAHNKFNAQYGKKSKITKDDIFAYVYAVLHNPIYRETYAINLKREFPRIPFYPDFEQWRDWGQRLMDLHIGYEKVKPWKLKRTDVEDVKAAKAGLSPKVSLKVDKDAAERVNDFETVAFGL